MAKARKAAPRKAASPKASAQGRDPFVADGYIIVVRSPLDGVTSDEWLLPLTVDMRHTTRPREGPHKSGTWTTTNPPFDAQYLDALIGEHRELEQVPRKELSLSAFMPNLSGRELEEQKKQVKTTIAENAFVLLSLLRIEQGLALEDVVPFIDAGLIPEAPNDDAQIQIAAGKDGFDITWDGGKVTRLSVADILEADMGYLLTSEMTGITAEVHRWPLSDVCSNVRQLEASGQAYLTSYMPDDSPANRDKQKQILLHSADYVAKGIRGLPLSEIPAAVQGLAARGSDKCI